MLTRRRSSVIVAILLVIGLTSSPRCEARSVASQPPADTAVEGEGDDYLDDYIGVNEDTIGIGPNGKDVLEDIFGSGLKEDGLTSRVDARSETSPGVATSNVDVEATVERVEKILAANPDLPRLSRAEILDIYRNLTSGNHPLTTTPIPTTLKPRDDSKKSLLVVLPFSANDMRDSNIEDLYTKRPVTQMIGAEFELPVKVAPQRATSSNDISYEHNGVNPSPVYKPPTSSKLTRPTTNHYRQTINSYDRSKPSHTSTTSPRPEKTSTRYENNLINKNHEATSTQRPSLVQYEIHKRKKPQTQPQETPKTRPHPAIEQYQDVNPFRPMPPPKLQPENHRSPAQDSNKVNSNAFRPVTTQRPPVTSNSKPVRSDIQTVLASLGLFPEMSPPTTTSTAKPVEEVPVGVESLTADMKNVLASLGLLPAASDVQPVVNTELNPPEEEVVIPKPAPTTVDIGSYANFKPLPSATDDIDGKSELKDILAKFGLVPGEGALNFDTLEQIDVTGHRGQKAMGAESGKNRIKSEEKEEEKAKDNVKSEEEDRTLENTKKEEEKTKDNVKSGEEDRTPENTKKETKNEDSTPENGKNSSTKEANDQKTPEVNVEGFSDEMKAVLENLGLVTTTSKSTEGHIFNPVSHATSLDTAETQFDKLNQLINTIQLLAKDNETFTQAEIYELNEAFNLRPVMDERDNKTEIDSIVTKDNSVVPLDQLLEGPDPLTTDELIDLYIKNEVKRQQPNETEAPSSTTEGVSSTTEATTTTETTEERVPMLTDFSDSLGGADEGAASLSDLADSFGGGETAEQTVSDADLPDKKPNGLYFLLDWNSFLEVGEEGKNKTTIRFTPRVGNPKNFLSVTVP